MDGCRCATGRTGGASEVIQTRVGGTGTVTKQALVATTGVTVGSGGRARRLLVYDTLMALWSGM